jgi:hypothetical protein
MRHGFTPERLHRLAQRIASDVIAGRVQGIAPIPHIGDKREDLVSAMTERGLNRVLRYNPALTNGGDHAQSFLSKHMEHAARDYFRRKSEGFGDRRYGNDNRIDLQDDPDPADHDTDFHELVDERRRARWQQAADRKGMPLSEFIVTALDIVAEQLEVAA